MAKIKETNEEMEEGCTQEARQKISEGYEFIKPRQKPIKLAYSSAAGWRAVYEYVKNKSECFRLGKLKDRFKSTNKSCEKKIKKNNKWTHKETEIYKQN